MRSTANAQRVAMLQASDAQRIQSDMRSRMSEMQAQRYFPYDDAGSGQASFALSLVRDALGARVDGTFYDTYPDDALRPILELVAPESHTHDDVSLARGFFQAYAQAAMTCATTRQLSLWVERYRARMDGRKAWAVDALCRRTLRGLATLRSFLNDAHESAADAAIEAYAALLARRADSRRWHTLSDGSRDLVQPGKRTARERKIARSHRTRAMRRMLGA